MRTSPVLKRQDIIDWTVNSQGLRTNYIILFHRENVINNGYLFGEKSVY